MCSNNKDIIKILTNFVSKYGNLYKGNFDINDTLNDAFNSISNNLKVIFCFDIEFHNQVINANTNFITYKKPIYPYVRELGIIIFVKENSKWKYLGNIFKNIDNEYDENTIFLLSKYTTVSDKTLKLMEKADLYFNIYSDIKNLTLDNLNKNSFNNINDNLSKDYIKKAFDNKNYNCIKKNLKLLKNITLIKQKEDIKQKKDIKQKEDIKDKLKQDFKYCMWKFNIIKDIPFRVYPKILNKEDKKICLDQVKYYNNDPQVKSRLLSNLELKKFLLLWLSIDEELCYVVKGKNDFIAIKNTMLKVLNHCNINFNKIYDIEVFNWLSYKKFGSAQLENTFIGINNTLKIDTIEKELNKILKHISFTNAHNPLVDSYYTLYVALYINIFLNMNLIK